MYKIIGYYICELIKIPQWLNRRGTMVSVSECFGGIHPRLDTCYFKNNYIKKEERTVYNKLWNLSDEKSRQLTKEIGNLLGDRLAIDGRFIHVSDALHFYHSYFSTGNCIVVSVSTTEKYFEVLKDELTNNSCGAHSFTEAPADENDLLGFDILGWDIGSFHSFLCNGLQKMLPTAQFNSYGLLENTFNEVATFSCQIQGHGEPVEWIPYRIGKCL